MGPVRTGGARNRLTTMARKKTKSAKEPAAVTDPGTPPRARAKPGPADNYDPAWCPRVIAYGSEGQSRAEISLSLGIGRRSLYRYMETYPDFAEAMDEAEWLSKAWWEGLGRRGVERGAKDAWSPQTYQFIMRNRFRSDYQDSQKQELELGAGFLKFMDAARKGEFKTPAPTYPKAVA